LDLDVLDFTKLDGVAKVISCGFSFGVPELVFDRSLSSRRHVPYDLAKDKSENMHPLRHYALKMMTHDEHFVRLLGMTKDLPWRRTKFQ
jgi:hypothetical protein